jgi:hypothetical protein
MIIDINYREYTLFDIEYYQAMSEKKNDKDCWYSEIHCLTCVKGITHFLKDKLNDPTFNVEEFINDSEIIEEIRGWLWETHDNKLCDLHTNTQRHYHVFKPELDKIIKSYCEKYGFSINID